MMIKAAACRTDDGTIYEGKDHSACIKQMAVKCLKGMQGFTTTEGKFVDRFEAAKIAFEAGQIPDDPKGDILISEEIWYYNRDWTWDESTGSYKLKEATCSGIQKAAKMN